MKKSQADAAIKAFNRIVKWLQAQKQAKAVLASLRQPATAKAIRDFEAKTKLKLPPALAAIYRLHDGQDEGAANEALDGETIESGLFPSIEGRGDLPFLLAPLKELRVSKVGMPGFRKGWVPFGDNYGGDNMVIDLASAAPKKRGRVLQFNHEYGSAVEVAPSFERYLEQIAAGLASKKIIWDEESGLSYKRGRNWDDLKVEPDEDESPERARPDPKRKTGTKASGGGRVDPALVGQWEVIEFRRPDRAVSVISPHNEGTVEFTAAGDLIARPHKQGLLRTEKDRYICARNHQPPWIDLVHPTYRDMRSLGIYQVTGDELLLCVNPFREARPENFNRSGSHIVHRMKRVSPRANVTPKPR